VRADETMSTTVAVAADSWYRASGACTTPLGCPSTPSTYPADTRHVGVQLGAEESRSYLQLDLAGLPADRRLLGAVLTVPLGDATDGTVNAETAKVQACVSFDSVKEADGAYTATPPDAPCQTASALGTLSAAAGTSPAALVFDLAPLAAVWQSSTAPGALALVPAPGAALTDTWHVAFSGAQRNGFPRPSASITFATSQPVPLPTPSPASAPEPIGQPGTPVLPGISAGGAPQPALPSAPVPTLASQATQGTQLVPVAVTLPRFRYKAVFLLPIVLAAVGVWLGRALTREV
jgi:hypothetical protein